MIRDESGRFTPLGQNDPTDDSVRTSERIAKEIGKSKKYVRRADQYARALDLADSVCPGIKKDILLGVINPTTKEVVALLKADEQELPNLIDELRGIKKPDEDTPEEMEQPRRPIEESIVDGSMIGLANMFIDGMNNYLIINFKSYSKSFRNKTRVDNPKEKWAIFKDVHEPIIDRETWERVQELTKNSKRRKPKNENVKKSIFTNLLYCGDCGHKLWFNINKQNPSIRF